jgi:hypothetical protein
MVGTVLLMPNVYVHLLVDQAITKIKGVKPRANNVAQILTKLGVVNPLAHNVVLRLGVNPVHQVVNFQKTVRVILPLPT